MEMAIAKEDAIFRAEKHYRHVAVIYRLEEGAEWGKTEWGSGAHYEARYIRSYDPFVDAVEIWICEPDKNPSEWNLYYSQQKPVDYVKETGATGELAELLKTIQSMDTSPPDQEDCDGNM